MNVRHALFTLGGIWIFACGHGPIRLPSDRIFGQLAHVAARNKIVERLRQLLLVRRILIEQRAQPEKIVAQHGFARREDRLLILRQHDGSKNNDDRDHDHQLKQSKTSRLRIADCGWRIDRSDS